MKRIPLSKVLENGLNPRDFENQTQRNRLNKLIKSIQEHGLMMPPILYRKKASRFYAPLDGHRRIRACRELGWDEIPYISTKDMGLPGVMSDSEALRYMFDAQGTTESWKARDKLNVIGEAVDAGVDIYIPERMESMKTVYGLAPGWLRELMRNKGGRGKSIGWTIVRDIMKHTTNEAEIRRWVELYLRGYVTSQKDLNRVMSATYDKNRTIGNIRSYDSEEIFLAMVADVLADKEERA